MLGMLRNIAEGRQATYGLTGRSAHGGASGTLAALHRHGLLIDGQLTPAGRQALEKRP
jgi:hypothetical protein